ncbi:transglutaminase family protein [Luteolibacter algae]|uniref:Transglutaminase family protein n=1 Tax=Luteolibacter algae TaxID=454151 RepID=A0ABW5D653_9BACT
MILRLISLIFCGALAYALLGGWPESLPVLPRTCLAVLVLLGGLCWWAAGREPDDLPLAKAARRPGVIDFAALGLGVLALECAFLWLLSYAPKPLEELAIVIEAKLQPAASAEREKRNAIDSVSGNWLWADQTERVLPKRTNLKPGAKPEVFLKLMKQEDADRLLKRQIYVRAFALDRFQDGVWSMREQPGRMVVADDEGWIRFDEKTEGEILHEVFIGKDPGGQNMLTALQGTRAARLPNLSLTAEAMGFLPDISTISGFEYLASSEPKILDDLRPETMPIFTENKEEGLDPGISELARNVAGNGELLDQLLNIQKFLRENYSYSLVTRNPWGLDPLENFLFEEKRGHCEFFATAGALMARALGVESRVAYGWAGGQYFQEDMMFVFRAREAHSWVEVKVEGAGWVVMEPTPPVVLGGGGRPHVAGAGEVLPAPEKALLEDESEGFSGGSGHVEKTALALMGVFAVVTTGIILGRAKGRHRIVHRGSPHFTHGINAGYLARWQKALSQKGLPSKPGTTLKKQLAEMDPQVEFGEELLGYHYGVRYEEKAVDERRERELMDKIEKWES